MHPAFTFAPRAAGVLALVVLGAGPLAAQEAKPAAPPARKLEIWNGPLRTVYYSLPEGSPHRQALYRILQWAENEVALVEQLQQLKLEYVANDRRLESFRTARQLSYAPWFCGGGCCGGDVACEPSLKTALSGQLAQEATPEAALRLIRLLEQAQTDIATEEKPAPPVPRMPPAQAEEMARTIVALLRRGAAAPSARAADRPQWPRRGLSGLVVGSRAPSSAKFGFASSAQWPAPRQAPDSEREALERERQVLEHARETFQQESSACLQRMQGTNAAARESGQKELQAARERWSNACAHWSEVCRHWSEVCRTRAEVQRATHTAPSHQNAEGRLVAKAPGAR